MPIRRPPRAKGGKAMRGFISDTIRHYIHKGRPQKQAIAIAYSQAGMSRGKGKGRSTKKRK